MIRLAGDVCGEVLVGALFPQCLCEDYLIGYFVRLVLARDALAL